MRIWATIWTDNQKVADTVIEADFKKARDVADWEPYIGAAAVALHLSRPVILKKHVRELLNFSRVAFKWDDFMEPVDFDRFVIELIH